METVNAPLVEIRRAPKQTGSLEMIVTRPGVGERECPRECEVCAETGLIGDNWRTRLKRFLPDGRPNPDTQVTVMSSRALSLIAGDKERWPLAGDNLIVDFDLSEDNLQPGDNN